MAQSANVEMSQAEQDAANAAGGSAREPEAEEPIAGAAPADAGAPRNGLVIAIAKGFFEVTDDQRTYLCVARGKFRKQRARPPHPAPSFAASARGSRATRSAKAAHAPAEPAPAEQEEAPLRIAVGDHVRFRPLGSDQGVIEEVEPRRTTLARSRPEVGGEHVMLANLDQAALVFAVREPAPHFGMLDRYLALCERAGVGAIILLNKLDLGLPDAIAEEASAYTALGYPVIYSSATTGAGLDELRQRLAGRVSLLTGPSGVGKSSLLNALLPDARQRTGAISDATGKGRHTTTGARLLPLPDGGWLADSAGIRELALWNVPADELARCFVELRLYAGQCLYDDCEHGEQDEDCALRRALAEGAITPSRFASFARLLDEAREAEPPRW